MIIMFFGLFIMCEVNLNGLICPEIHCRPVNEPSVLRRVRLLNCIFLASLAISSVIAHQQSLMFSLRGDRQRKRQLE